MIREFLQKNENKQEQEGESKMKTLFIENGVAYGYLNNNDTNLIDQVKKLRHDVYVACGFIEPTKTRTIEDKKDSDCYYMAAMDTDHQEIIGTVRLSKPPFKVLEALKHDKIDVYPQYQDLIDKALSSKTLEVGALAVRPKLKTGKSHISGGLYTLVYLFSLQNNVDYLLIDIDQTVGESLKRLGWKLVQFAPEHEYMGSITIPAIMPISEQLDSLKEKNPNYTNFVLNIIKKTT